MLDEDTSLFSNQQGAESEIKPATWAPRYNNLLCSQCCHTHKSLTKIKNIFEIIYMSTSTFIDLACVVGIMKSKEKWLEVVGQWLQLHCGRGKCVALWLRSCYNPYTPCIPYHSGPTQIQCTLFSELPGLKAQRVSCTHSLICSCGQEIVGYWLHGLGSFLAGALEYFFFRYIQNNWCHWIESIFMVYWNRRILSSYSTVSYVGFHTNFTGLIRAHLI
jgi:hypothetical protein